LKTALRFLSKETRIALTCFSNSRLYGYYSKSLFV